MSPAHDAGFCFLPRLFVVLPAFLGEPDGDEDEGDDDGAGAFVGEVDVPDPLSSLPDARLGADDGDAYRSAYHPPPLRMKLLWVMSRRAFSLPHDGHLRTGSSVMRCSRSNSCPQASQPYS